MRLSGQELGIVCVLLLRGAQTPGELRTRSERLCKFSDVNEVEGVLETLMTRDDGPFVARLPREAGRRESRYVHLFCGEVPVSAQATETAPDAAAMRGLAADDDRLGRIEGMIAELRREVDAIKSAIEKMPSNP